MVKMFQRTFYGKITVDYEKVYCHERQFNICVEKRVTKWLRNPFMD